MSKLVPNGVGSFLFPTNQDLAIILGRVDFHSEKFHCFFPQPLVDGFSKLWLRGKGNLRVETLIPAGSALGPCSARAHAQKQQYLQGFSHDGCKNNNI